MSTTATTGRLPDATRLGAAHLQVSGMERSLRYYRDFLGFAVLESAGATAMLGAHEDERVLLVLHEKPGASPVPRRGRLGLFHFAILLPDRAALGRFAGHLARMGAPAGSSDHLVSEAIYLQDPDGLGIEVYADRPRSAWQHLPNGEIAMSTEPLDVASLLRAAGDAPWTGMPGGTVLGHMHLHVGDLPTAERFYVDAFGFDVVVRGYPGALFVSAGGYHHHLGLNTWAAHAAPAGPDDARLLEWTVVLPKASDLDGALERMRAAGHEVTDGALVRDPWGTALRIVAG